MRRLLGAMAACVLLAGCSTTGCLDNQSAIPLAEFYSSTTQEAVGMSGITIHGVGAPGDSVVLNTPPAASQVYLPMRSTRSVTRWCITYRQDEEEAMELTDTISLRYDSEPYFASEECGAMYTYRLTDVGTTHTYIDSVAVLDSLVTNIDKAYLRIYFRTAEPEEEGEERL